MNDESRYSEFAVHIVEGIIEKISVCTDTASQSASCVLESQQYTTWIKEFCARMKDIIAMRPDELKMIDNCNIKNFTNYQKYLTSGLQNLGQDIKSTFKHVDINTVEWYDVENPFQKAFKRLWGCPEHCPFCREPCQFAAHHTNTHRCIQHRPPGIKGTLLMPEGILYLQTCSKLVTTDLYFGCGACENQCEPHHGSAAATTAGVFFGLLGHIVGMATGMNFGTVQLPGCHPCKEYKKFLPRWDIAPDPVNEASKFWQWAVCTFQAEIRELHHPKILEIPDSWRKATKHEAIECLREFLQ